MEKEKFESFVQPPIQEKRVLKTTNKIFLYEQQEMTADSSVFSESSQPILSKFLEMGHSGLSPLEERILEEERNKWWQNKYGFPYENKTARDEVLRRKYDNKDVEEENDLQRQLFLAVRNKDNNSIKELKKSYEEKYPDQLEGVVALFELTPFLKTQAEIEKYKKPDEKRKKMFEELTQYQFLLTHFINFNSKDKDFLWTFWEVAERLAKEANQLKEMHMLQRNIISQVAAIKILKALGKDPVLSHPSEDAFNAIDLWIEEEKTAIQVKGTKQKRNANLKISDSIAFPGIELKHGSDEQYFNSWEFWQMQKFKAKLSKYKKLTGKNVNAYLMIVPYPDIDFITGQPSDNIIKFFKEKLSSRKSETESS